MNKIMAFIFLLSGLYTTNALASDHTIHPKKINSERPGYVYSSAAVPPCQDDIVAYLAAVQEKTRDSDSSSNQLHKKGRLSQSQELRRLP